MKPIARLTIDIAATAAAIVLACCAAACSRSAPDYDDTPRGRVSIAHLKALCTAESVVITGDIAIEGYVAANDLYGEYSRTIVLCDASGGIEIAVDSRRTAETFPIAARVTVHCTSLALGDYGGRVDTSAPQAVKTVVVSIAGISPALVGSQVQIDDVTFGPEAGLAWCDTDPASGGHVDTARTITDRSGRTLSVRTIAECEYRTEKIPAGYGSLRGIVEYFNGEYSLRITNHQILFPSGGITQH